MIISPPAVVRDLFAENIPLPPRLVLVIGMIVYMSLRSYGAPPASSPGGSGLRWCCCGWRRWAGFAPLVRPTFTWSETTQRRGAVLWLFDVLGQHV